MEKVKTIRSGLLVWVDKKHNGWAILKQTRSKETKEAYYEPIRWICDELFTKEYERIGS